MSSGGVMSGGADAGRRRLHPLTPLLRGARSLAAIVAVLSWQGYAQLGPTRWLMAVAVVAVVALAGSVVSWAVTGYQLTGRELRVTEGLLWRRTRVIPLERVQAVDVVRPVLARLTGLAEVRLEVIGASRTEGRLAFLTVEQAAALRQRLVGLVAGARKPAAAPATAATTATAADPDPDPVTDPATATAQTPTPEAVERPVHAVDNRDVLVGQLMTVPIWLVPVGLIVTAVPLVTEANWSFVGVASTLTALVGVVQAPLRRILADWDFRISVEPSGLRLRHGLLETRNHTVPPGRIQAVGVTWPLLWRPLGFSRARIDVAGYGGRDAGLRAGVLLPVARAPVTSGVVAMALTETTGAPQEYDVTLLPLAPPPARARWLAPLTWRVLGFAVTDRLVVARHGLLTRELVAAPLVRVQSVRVVQGPLQRALGLASVHVDTAGTGLGVVGEHRAVEEAYALADVLAAAARAARTTSPAVNGPNPDPA